MRVFNYLYKGLIVMAPLSLDLSVNENFVLDLHVLV